MDLTYRREFYPDIGPDEFIDLLVRSTLAERRPVDEPETIRGMLEHAEVIITARIGGRLVGISRDHRFQLLHLSVRPGRRSGLPAAGNRQGADPPDPRGGRLEHNADPPGRAPGPHVLSSHRHAAS